MKNINVKREHYDIIKELSDKQAGEFVKGVCAYAFEGKPFITKDEYLKGLFMYAKRMLDISETNRINGKKGADKLAEIRRKERAVGVIIGSIMAAKATNEDSKKVSKILCGDAAECLRALPRESVNMCVTSPPYYGLRDYGEQNQIGIEQTPSEYIARLVEVFDEIYRVLKKDGTLWVNIGDSYAGSGKGPMTLSANGKNKDVFDIHNRIYEVPKSWSGIKPKDLIGIPWMLAFALRERGWYLRSDIIWYKTNCLPESVKDRPTKTYEHIFLFAKSRQYYFDYKAIREPLKQVTKERYKRGRSDKFKYTRDKTLQGINRQHEDFSMFDQEYRRKRDVWEVSTNSYRMDEHFAMFPERLIEPCILAGSKVGGTVLDPFFGSGTTGAVAKRLGREYIGIDLNARYLAKAKERIDSIPSIA